MYNFEKLKAWQEAVALSEMVYRFVVQLPREERFALTDQLKRAATSVVLNIAEGSASSSRKSFVSFLEIARGSLFETVAALKLAEKLFKLEATGELVQCETVTKLLYGLLKSLKSDNNVR